MLRTFETDSYIAEADESKVFADRVTREDAVLFGPEGSNEKSIRSGEARFLIRQTQYGEIVVLRHRAELRVDGLEGRRHLNLDRNRRRLYAQGHFKSHRGGRVVQDVGCRENKVAVAHLQQRAAAGALRARRGRRRNLDHAVKPAARHGDRGQGRGADDRCFARFEQFDAEPNPGIFLGDFDR
ncbi:MAG: hypothetical protein JNM56_38010 [Planctomycetia bacterium]|nr:hypothetical protein [Planctomycetia bacterium]